MYSFEFPDIADFPLNDAEVIGDTIPAPAFYHRPRFDRDISKLFDRIGDRIAWQPGAKDILHQQLMRTASAAKAYFKLPPVHGCELSGSGITTRQADTESLQRHFREEIAALRLSSPSDDVKSIDRSLQIQNQEDLNVVQGFLTKLGLLREANRYRKTMRVASVALQVSRPGDRHHLQCFQDLAKPTALLNLHSDPKPGILKAIIYLNEVEEDNGPFQYVKGSSKWRCDEIERLFAWGNSVGNYCHTPLHRQVACALPKRFRKSANFGQLVPETSEFGQRLLRGLSSVTSEDATVMLFDPCFVFHRGGLCRKGERVNLQVVLK